MRLARIAGILLMIAGAIVLILRGVSYTKDRDAVKVGPIEIAAEEKGFISPAVGAIALAAGLILLVATRRS